MLLNFTTGIPVLDNILLIAFVGFVILLIIGFVLFIISIKVFQKTFIPPKSFTRGKNKPKYAKYKDLQEQYLKEYDNLDKEEVYIKGYKNKKAHGTLIKSKTNSKKVIIFAHGWKSNGLNDYICGATFLHRHDYNVLVIDQYAHNESEGKYISFGMYDKFNVLKWVDYINEYFQKDCEIYLMGVSMGSSTVLWLASRTMENVHGIIGDSGYYNGYELAKYFIAKNISFVPNLVAFMTRIVCKIFAGFDIKKCDLKEALTHSKYPILLFHGDKDDFVPIEHTVNAYNDCTSKKEIVIFEGSNHIIASLMHQEKYENHVIKFIEEN